MKKIWQKMCLAIYLFFNASGGRENLNDELSETVEPVETADTVKLNGVKQNTLAQAGTGKQNTALGFSGLNDLDQIIDNDRVGNAPGVLKEPFEEKTRKTPMPPNLMGGKRISMDTENSITSGAEGLFQFSRFDYWRRSGLMTDLNNEKLSQIQIHDLAEMITEMSPEVSAAVWYYLLACNSGFEIKAYKPKTKNVDDAAQESLEEMLSTLSKYNGNINVYFDKLFLGIFLRGSVLLELIVGNNGRDFVDIASPDTKTLVFKQIKDELRGQIWDFGQLQNGKFVSLMVDKIKYVPLHPLPGKIEGRPMITSAFFVCLFLMSVLRDFKRVIQQQGYLRLDLEVIFEKLQAAMPEDASKDAETFQIWADSVVNQISQFYSKLEPDDAYVHSDAVKINAPVGTATASSMDAMDGLFKALERMCARGLKTMPLLMGIRDGGNAATSNREFEFYIKGIEGVQRLVESAAASVFQMGLQAKGMRAEVSVKFQTLRSSEELRDTQTLWLKAQVARFLYDAGIISMNEMAMLALKKETADQQTPRTDGTLGGQTNNIGNLQPETDINRFANIEKMLRSGASFEELRTEFTRISEENR